MWEERTGHDLVEVVSAEHTHQMLRYKGCLENMACATCLVPVLSVAQLLWCKVLSFDYVAACVHRSTSGGTGSSSQTYACS